MPIPYKKKHQALKQQNPLNQPGLRRLKPPNFLTVDRAPTTRDYDNFQVGDVWLDRTTVTSISANVYKLVRKTVTAGMVKTAIWIQYTGGFLKQLTDDSDTVVLPGPDGGIKIQGGDNINTTSAANTIIVNVDRGLDGQLLIGSTGNPGVWATLTEGANITITEGPGIITITSTAGPGGDITMVGNDGSTATSILNVINVLGGVGRIITSGLGQTFTIDIENGPAGEVLIGGGANAAWAAITSTDATIVLTPGVNTLNIDLSNGTNGQVLVGGGTQATWANITSALGTITITEGVNTLNIEAPGGGVVNAGENINISPVAIVNLNRTIHWEDTNAAGTEGMIYLGGVAGVGGTRFMHNFGVTDTFLGEAAGNLAATGGGANTGVGAHALNAHVRGSENTCIGAAVGWKLTVCEQNSALGGQCFYTATTGSYNTAMGSNALRNLVTGHRNCGIGFGEGAGVGAGVNYTGAESNNVCINHNGVLGENNTMHIGTHGAGNGQQSRCFLAGVRGITTGVANAVPVLIDSAYQLGTISSALRYKENIQNIGTESVPLYKLRPVTFNYKSDETKSKQYGLIAEEVQEHFPRLVVNNDKGEIETVKYMELITLTLNEVINQRENIKNLKDRLRILEEQVSLILEKTQRD